MNLSALLELPTHDGQGNVDDTKTRRLEVASEYTGIRLIFDPTGNDDEHTLLIEAVAGGWLLLLHPNSNEACLAVKLHGKGISVCDGEDREILKSSSQE